MEENYRGKGKWRLWLWLRQFVLQGDFSWRRFEVAEGKGGGGGGCGGLFSNVFLVGEEYTVAEGKSGGGSGCGSLFFKEILVGGDLKWQRERAAVVVAVTTGGGGS